MPPRVSPKRAEAVKLARTLPVRAVAERVGVSKSTVAAWLAEERAAVAAGKPSAASKRAAKASPPPSAPDAATPPSEPATGLPDDLAGVDLASLDFAALEELDRDCKSFLASARDEGDARQYAVLARLQLEVRSAMAKLRPTTPPDPELDPGNVEARDRIVGRIERAVADLEREPLVRAAMRAHLDALDAAVEEA